MILDAIGYDEYRRLLTPSVGPLVSPSAMTQYTSDVVSVRFLSTMSTTAVSPALANPSHMMILNGLAPSEQKKKDKKYIHVQNVRLSFGWSRSRA